MVVVVGLSVYQLFQLMYGSFGTVSVVAAGYGSCGRPISLSVISANVW